MLAIFVEVVRDVFVAAVWIAAGVAAVGMGFVLVVVGLAVALRETWHEADWSRVLGAAFRLLVARARAPVHLSPMHETPALPAHAAPGDHAPPRVPEPADEARCRA